MNVLKRQLQGPEGEPLELPARAFDALLFLIEHRHEDMGKDRLMKALWPDTIVEENNLNQAIFSLRRALGDSANDPQFIMTIPGRGYRFIADVTEISAAPDRGSRARAWLVPLAVAALVAAAGLAWTLWPERAAEAVPASIAVLTFKALLPEQSDPALELGMTDSLIGQISTIPGIKVSALAAVRRVDAPDQDPLAAGKALGVEAVLESSVLRQGERVRVTARLLRVSDGQSLWSGKFDEASSNILAVQDSIAERVAQTLAPHLSPARALARAARPTENAEAYRLYAEGFYNQQRRDIDGLPEAARRFEAALLLDPGYVQAWGALSRVLAAQAAFGTQPPLAVYPRAKQAALRAVELDAQSAEAHTALAHVLVVYDRQYRDANEHYEIAKRLDPRIPEIYLLSSINLMNLGRVDASLAEARRALALEPASLLFRANLGMLLYYARSYDEAERELRRVVELQPRFDHAKTYLGRTLLARADTAGALQQFATRVNPSPGSHTDPGRAFAVSGRAAEARQEIERLRRLGTQGFAVSYDLAAIHAALGATQQACEALAAAIQDRSPMVGMMQIDPGMDPLRSSPCFAEVSHRLYADPRR